MTGGIRVRGLACAALAAAGLVLLAGVGPVRAGVTKRVSVSSKGAQGDDDSGNSGVAISADGRFVAFDSYATTLVPGDSNGVPDIFVRDRVRGTTERVSLGPHGVQAEGGKGEGSYGPSISGNGRFVAFSSYATNLVAGDTNGFEDVFVRDRESGTTERVSVGPHGVQANGSSDFPSISANGRFVAFESHAANLVPGDTNGAFDVFVHDRLKGTTERVSVGPHGRQGDNASQGAAIAADGLFVVFQSYATNLVPGGDNGQIGVYVRDRARGVTELVSVGPRGARADDASFIGAISADGRFVAFGSFADNLVPDDTNGSFDTFVRDRLRDTTERVSVASDGAQGNGGSGGPSISANGRFVAFQSSATDLVPGDTNGELDIFVRDRVKGTTERVSVGPGGAQGDLGSFEVSISGNGRLAAFSSEATNLVPGDTNRTEDVFVHHR